jgi:Ca-activated chloride channel family protein
MKEPTMTRKFSLLLFACALLAANLALAFDRLWIQHPQQNWRQGQGTIEQAVITVRPQGVYMEYGLYLTLSARGLGFSLQDSVEVQCFFDLPKEAIVHDLWLWVDDQIMRALIMDRWTASGIYENIVKRRRDPAILFKNSATGYELRIYPLPGTKTRKIKLTYLVPAEWSPSAVTAVLPTGLLRTSARQLATFNLIYWPHQDWRNPRLLEYPNVNFTTLNDQEFGTYVRSDIPANALAMPLHFTLDSPLRNGVYVSRYEQGNTGFYQLALLPAEALDLNTPRKVALLFDYSAGKSTVTGNQVAATVKSLLHAHLAATDSFNLIFSRLNILRAGSKWFAGDSASIERAFANAGANPITSYSNLPALLANGIDFVKRNGNDGSLLLIANSDQFGDYRAANPLISDLLRNMSPALPIHVADFANQNQVYYSNGGRTYVGNEYLYENLTRQTSGSYGRISAAGSFTALLTQALQKLSGFVDSFDLHTTLANGFCFGRFNFGLAGQALNVDQPILQAGKYNGGFPFVIEASGVFNGQAFSRRLEIASNEVHVADSLAEEIWTGNHIAGLEAQTQSNEVVRQIIETSVAERVLSRYTAFLALEPSDTVKACVDCKDESRLVPPTAIAEREQDVLADSVLQAYPNPFNLATKLSLRLPSEVKSGEATLQIFNVLGQMVKSFEVNVEAQRRAYQFTWDGRNNAGEVVTSGTYYAVFKTAKQRHTLKLLVMK